MATPARAEAPIILPRTDLPWEMFQSICLTLGMTNYQRELAWRSAHRMDPHLDGVAGRIIQAGDRMIAAWRELENALNVERSELLSALLVTHPAAARRIMKAITPSPTMSPPEVEAQVVPFNTEPLDPPVA